MNIELTANHWLEHHRLERTALATRVGRFWIFEHFTRGHTALTRRRSAVVR